ncbi:MAG TPA: hypothetical protein VF669_08815 [Tepidisphaeraceae bacterium]
MRETISYSSEKHIDEREPLPKAKSWYGTASAVCAIGSVTLFTLSSGSRFPRRLEPFLMLALFGSAFTNLLGLLLALLDRRSSRSLVLMMLSYLLSSISAVAGIFTFGMRPVVLFFKDIF